MLNVQQYLAQDSVVTYAEQALCPTQKAQGSYLDRWSVRCGDA